MVPLEDRFCKIRSLVGVSGPRRTPTSFGVFCGSRKAASGYPNPKVKGGADVQLARYRRFALANEAGLLVLTTYPAEEGRQRHDQRNLRTSDGLNLS